MIERFDDHVFELIAQELFDGDFVLWVHLRVISQHADGAEIALG